MNKIILSGIFILFISASGAVSYADIYKYTDENGTSYFTNTPQDNVYRKTTTVGRKAISRPESKTQSNKYYDQIIESKSLKYNIRPSLINAVITVESDWDPEAISKKGAIGLMQLMPSTAKDMQIENPFDPEENIEGGTRYLRYLLNRFNEDINLALAAYNAGPGLVERFGGIPSISETKNFVKKVISISKDNDHAKTPRIYKVTYEDGSTIFTNTPFPYMKYKLSSF
ncbi:MAG: lytic transglycosylase domain-containing protein [Thermodesulfovibrionia bacterium]|nr:lytic transglycosylase domain-containing protein [Thermodesulfovibrionia bacterium]